VITARSVKAVLDNLREDELDLPFIVCPCNSNPAMVVDAFMSVTATEILLHRGQE
jgi:hypothetical protein